MSINGCRMEYRVAHTSPMAINYYWIVIVIDACFKTTSYSRWRQNKSPALHFTYLFSDVLCLWDSMKSYLNRMQAFAVGSCVCIIDCLCRCRLVDDLCDLFTHVCILYLRRQREQQLFILPWQRAYEQKGAFFFVISPKRAYGCCLPPFNTCTVHSAPNEFECESNTFVFGSRKENSFVFPMERHFSDANLLCHK